MATPSSLLTQASNAQATASSTAGLSSISRLCLTRIRPTHLRRRARTPIFSACFEKTRLTSTGVKFGGVIAYRRLWLPPAASSDDWVSVSVHGSEGGKSEEALKKSASDLADVANHSQETLKEKASEATGEAVESGKDTVHKAEAGLKEDSSDASAKFIGVLRDTTEELKEQAEKARAALTVTAQETAAALAATAQETAERSKSYITENAPDPIKEIADTALKAHSSDTPKKFAKIHDFCLGIPYGTFLVIGGLLWFIISGSTAAIRFGVILGGILLGLSVSSLNIWKQGKSTSAYIQGQAVIAGILAFREVRRLSEVSASFPAVLITLISAGMLGFYCYVLLAGGSPPPKKTKHAPAA